MYVFILLALSIWVVGDGYDAKILNFDNNISPYQD